MTRMKALLAFFGLAAGVAVAQMPPEEPRERLDGAPATLDAARAAKVHAILLTAEQKARVAREQIGPARDETTRITLYAAMEAIRADTEEKLAAILSEEELARVKVNLPPRPAHLEALRFRRI